MAGQAETHSQTQLPAEVQGLRQRMRERRAKPGGTVGAIGHPGKAGPSAFEICGELYNCHEGKTKSLKRETYHFSNKAALHSRCWHKADRPRESCNKALNGGGQGRGLGGVRERVWVNVNMVKTHCLHV